MKKFDYVIKDELGIHARPAAKFVVEANKFKSKAVIECNGKNAEVSNLLSVMCLGVKQGDKVTITLEGPDEELACNAIKKFMQDNL